MGNKVVVIRGEETFEFDNVIGHQVGNGAVQVLERSGNQRIINRYDDVFVTLDEEAAAQFAMDLAEMENPAVKTGEPEVRDEGYEDEDTAEPSVQ